MKSVDTRAHSVHPIIGLWGQNSNVVALILPLAMFINVLVVMLPLLQSEVASVPVVGIVNITLVPSLTAADNTINFIIKHMRLLEKLFYRIIIRHLKQQSQWLVASSTTTSLPC